MLTRRLREKRDDMFPSARRHTRRDDSAPPKRTGAPRLRITAANGAPREELIAPGDERGSQSEGVRGRAPCAVAASGIGQPRLSAELLFVVEREAGVCRCAVAPAPGPGLRLRPPSSWTLRSARRIRRLPLLMLRLKRCPRLSSAMSSITCQETYRYRYDSTIVSYQILSFLNVLKQG